MALEVAHSGGKVMPNLVILVSWILGFTCMYFKSVINYWVLKLFGPFWIWVVWHVENWVLSWMIKITIATLIFSFQKVRSSSSSHDKGYNILSRIDFRVYYGHWLLSWHVINQFREEGEVLTSWNGKMGVAIMKWSRWCALKAFCCIWSDINYHSSLNSNFCNISESFSWIVATNPIYTLATFAGNKLANWT